MTKIQQASNYAMFHRGDKNRPTDVERRRRLVESMKRYGFLRCFPIVVRRRPDGRYEVKDGQHRLAVAEALGLPVWYVEDDSTFDVAFVNSTPVKWDLKDFAGVHAANGLADYQEAIDFAKRHGLPVSTAAALLAGTTSFSNVKDDFCDGRFTVRDRPWAEAVAALYMPLVGLNRQLRNLRLTEACMGVCRVPGFDAQRLLRNAARCREKLVPYSTREAYLVMLEEVYNFGQQRKVGLKAEATMAMAARNSATARTAAKNDGGH